MLKRLRKFSRPRPDILTDGYIFDRTAGRFRLAVYHWYITPGHVGEFDREFGVLSFRPFRYLTVELYWKAA